MYVQGSQFWMALKKFSGVTLSYNAKNILADCGYDNPLSFVKITQNTFGEMNDYIYNEYEESGFISPGDRELILQIVELAKVNYQSFLTDYCTKSYNPPSYVNTAPPNIYNVSYTPSPPVYSTYTYQTQSLTCAGSYQLYRINGFHNPPQ